MGTSVFVNVVSAPVWLFTMMAGSSLASLIVPYGTNLLGKDHSVDC